MECSSNFNTNLLNNLNTQLLVSKYVDSMRKLEDFDVVKEALLTIVEPEGNHYVAPTLTDRVTALKNMIDYPEQYVQIDKDSENFKTAVLKRILAIIDDINGQKNRREQMHLFQQEFQQSSQAIQTALHGIAQGGPPDMNSMQAMQTLMNELAELSEKSTQLIESDPQNVVNKMIERWARFGHY